MINIKKFADCKESTVGAFIYLHLITFREDGHAYTIKCSDEAMSLLIQQFKKAGNTVHYTCVTE